MAGKRDLMPLYSLIVLAVFALIGLMLPGQSEAAPAALQKVIDGAKKEGLLKILWTEDHFGAETGIQAIIDAVNKKYGTKISLQFTHGGSFPENLGRLTQEYRAKQRASTDVFLGSAGHIVSGLESGMLEKVDWDGLAERPAPAKPLLNRVAPEGVAMAVASRVVGIVYNTNLVKGADVPVSMEDVLKPKFKGQIATTPYVTGFYQFAAPDILGIEYMRGYVRRLAPLIGGMIPCNSLDPVASGQFAILLFDCGRDSTLRYQKKGAPLEQAVPKEIVRDNVIYLGVPRNAEHPNASKLFINFVHTEEGQDLLWKYGAYDLEIYPGSDSYKLIQEYKKKYPGAKYAADTAQRELELKKQGVDLAAYQKEIRDIFRGAKK